MVCVHVRYLCCSAIGQLHNIQGENKGRAEMTLPHSLRSEYRQLPTSKRYHDEMCQQALQKLLCLLILLFLSTLNIDGCYHYTC